MALIKCAECGRDISDLATACPNCGRPVNVRAVTTIQLTHKKWKASKVLGIALVFFGFIVVAANVGLGLFFILLGFCLGTIGKIGAWWNHA